MPVALFVARILLNLIATLARWTAIAAYRVVAWMLQPPPRRPTRIAALPRPRHPPHRCAWCGAIDWTG